MVALQATLTRGAAQGKGLSFADVRTFWRDSWIKGSREEASATLILLKYLASCHSRKKLS